MIRVVGFSGTVDITWVGDARTMIGKSSGGAACVATSHKSEKTANEETSTVVENNGKQSFIGLTIHEDVDWMSGLSRSQGQTPAASETMPVFNRSFVQTGTPLTR